MQDQGKDKGDGLSEKEKVSFPCGTIGSTIEEDLQQTEQQRTEVNDFDIVVTGIHNVNYTNS